MKVWTSPAMGNAPTIIEFQSLAAGRSLLSFYAPPPPGVPPANIQLTARTRWFGPFLFCARKGRLRATKKAAERAAFFYAMPLCSGDLGLVAQDQRVGDLADVDRGAADAGCTAGGFVPELALDLATGCDGQVGVDDIAGNAGG